MPYSNCAPLSLTRGALSAFVVGCLAVASLAQEFRSDPIDDKARLLGAKAQQSVRSAANYSANKAVFDEYFQKYYFPAMTRSTPAGLAELGKLRVDLFKKFLWDTSNEELQRDLTNMALKSMGKVVIGQGEPPYHPAVRYNAVLVVGQLDEQYAIESGGNSRPPKPHPTATKALTTIVDRGMTGDQFPPPVILGALIGLERHAKYKDGMTPAAADAMTAALLKIVNQDKPIQELDPEVYSWIRLRAANALSELGSVGPQNTVHQGLSRLISGSESLDDRCAAAALLNKLKYEGVKLDDASTEALFKLAHDLGVEESKRAKEFEQLRVGGGGGFVSQRAEQVAMSDPNAPQDSYPRRHVLSRLMKVRTGLRAVRPAVSEDAQKKIDAIIAAMKPAIDAAANDESVSLRIAELVRNMSDQIDEIVDIQEEPADEDFSAGGAPPAADAAPAAATPAPPAEAPAEAPPAEAPAPAPETPAAPATPAVPAEGQK